MHNPNWPKDRAMDDDKCWSDTEFCKSAEKHYALAKTTAEHEAWEYAERTELDIITICPSFVIGPMLQSTPNAASMLLLRLLKDGLESRENKEDPIVDVRDVAEALVLVYEKTEAKGRHVCTSYSIRRSKLVENLQKMYPNYNFPKSFTEVEEDLKLSSGKLQNRGWKYRPLEDTIVCSVGSYQERGLLDEV